MKILRFSDFQTRLPFAISSDNRDNYLEAFLSTELGKIYQGMPWDNLVKSLGLKSKRKGPQSIFSPQGKIALMVLKHYACVSDQKLIAQLNANTDYQIFCDLIITPNNRLHNFKIVSEIRCELGQRLDIPELQKVLAESWRPYCSNKDSMTCDATCYESYVRFPTDVKLLFETVLWNYKQLKSICYQRKERLIRSKYNKWNKRYKSYCKSRRPSRKATNAMLRGLLRLLRKIHETLLLIELDAIYQVPSKYFERRSTTAVILRQQEGKFFEGIKPTNRIISLDRNYIRPIVRGKEIKKVEFGAKVNKLQVDGISFIEHLSFDAFNEGTRWVDSIHLAQELMKTQTKIVGADKIYATNKNRNYATANNIKTDFPRKGRPSKHKNHYSQLQAMITKERATRLEGSFGTDKEHFLLNRIKARTKETERLWIFFGIHTSNALKIGRRKAQSLAQAA